MEENAALARRMYERMGEREHHDSAVRFRQRAEDAEHHAGVIRDVLMADMTDPLRNDER